MKSKIKYNTRNNLYLHPVISLTNSYVLKLMCLEIQREFKKKKIK
jgi:hypothetical protein